MSSIRPYMELPQTFDPSKIRDQSVDFRTMNFSTFLPTTQRSPLDCAHPQYNFPNTQGIPVPCGSCVGCSKRKQSEAATAFTLELLPYQLSHKPFYFITLTYEDAFLPHVDVPYVTSMKKWFERNPKAHNLCRKYGITPYNEAEPKDRSYWYYNNVHHNVALRAWYVEHRLNEGQTDQVTTKQSLRYKEISDVKNPNCFKRLFRKYLERYGHKYPEFDMQNYSLQIVGEYGSGRGRAHYHAIIAGIPKVLLINATYYAWSRPKTDNQVALMQHQTVLTYVGRQMGKTEAHPKPKMSLDVETELREKRVLKGHTYVQRATIGAAPYLAGYINKKFDYYEDEDGFPRRKVLPPEVEPERKFRSEHVGNRFIIETMAPYLKQQGYCFDGFGWEAERQNAANAANLKAVQHNNSALARAVPLGIIHCYVTSNGIHFVPTASADRSMYPKDKFKSGVDYFSFRLNDRLKNLLITEMGGEVFDAKTKLARQSKRHTIDLIMCAYSVLEQDIPTAQVYATKLLGKDHIKLDEHLLEQHELLVASIDLEKFRKTPESLLTTRQQELDEIHLNLIRNNKVHHGAEAKAENKQDAGYTTSTIEPKLIFSVADENLDKLLAQAARFKAQQQSVTY